MKWLSPLWLIVPACWSCDPAPEMSSVDPVNWEKRMVDLAGQDSLQRGSTYLSVYSEIYSQTEHIKHPLTATISLRNTSHSDTVFVESADYYDTKGQRIRSYFSRPIYLSPMETVEIVIDQVDETGGSGANFLFQWHVKPGVPEPLFEGVMISTSGQQGLSFTTRGVRID